MVLAPAFALGAVCAVQASGLARFTASEMVAVTMGFATIPLVYALTQLAAASGLF